MTNSPRSGGQPQDGTRAGGDLAHRLMEEENIERLIIRNISDGIIVTDAGNRYRIINPRAERYLNVEGSEVLGRDAVENLDLILSRNRVENAEAWREMGRGNAEAPLVETTGFIRLAAPVERILKIISLPLLNEAGMSNGRLTVLHDITEHHRADALKNNLISLVSHELRTPLTSIKGVLSMLRENSQAGTEELLKIAGRNCERLVRMVDNILDVNRYRFGKVKHMRERIDLKEVAQSALLQVAEAADRARIAIRVDFWPRTFHILGDRLRLEQVCINLLENAIAHSTPGSAVTVSAEPVPDSRRPPPPSSGDPELFQGEESRASWVKLVVEDRGEGIPPENLEMIFEPFFQSDISLTRKSGGLGLGLTLCRAIIEEHGGRIWCQSRVGEGSRFCLELPQERMPAAPPACDAPDATAGARPRVSPPVLVVDDDPDLVEVISLTLTRSGYRAVKAFNGPMALDLVRELDPWAIILDVRMPGMDGFSVLENLRRDPVKGGIPVIMLTAGGDEGREQARAMGVRAYLHKPFEESSLLKELENLRERNDVDQPA